MSDFDCIGIWLTNLFALFFVIVFVVEFGILIKKSLKVLLWFYKLTFNWRMINFLNLRFIFLFNILMLSVFNKERRKPMLVF